MSVDDPSTVETTADTRRDALMRSLESSLRRLQTDHIDVDVYFNHAVNDVGRPRGRSNGRGGTPTPRPRTRGPVLDVASRVVAYGPKGRMR
jgi:aryl-alcohol dehydrogenase-like predicted oxidoreductase